MKLTKNGAGKNVAETADRRPLFTIGHSNHELDTFIQLLKRHGCEVLVDVRSHPYSRYVQHFNQDAIQKAVREAGIDYLFLGKELGGRPQEGEYYDEEGHVLYYRLAESPQFLEGIARLESGIRRFSVAVMCSEENPAVCHRYLLVSRVLTQRGVPVCHIRGDGSIQPHSELEPVTTKQRSLFDSSEDSEWKSIRSVLPRSQPRISSDSSSVTESSDWSMSD
jgi:uncharacterized protein (DUF488 family)